jgi:stearoyl-CoA desaturase (delta-9 desaturase)
VEKEEEPPVHRLSYDIAAALVLLWIYWFMLTNYVSIVLHRSIAHRAFALPRWWSLTITALTNMFIIYTNPRVFVAEHRLHHAHSDTDKDPDKLPGQGYWTWFAYLMLHNPSPHEPHLVQVSRDKIFDSWVMRFFSSWKGKVLSEMTGVTLPLLAFRRVGEAFAFWLGIRLLGLTVKSIQSYYAHGAQKGWGYRSYDLPDGSANIRHPIAAWLSAGESLQNNHHAKPTLPIHAHRPDEWDAGYSVVKILDWCGLVEMPAGRRATMYQPKDSKFAIESDIEDPLEELAKTS